MNIHSQFGGNGTPKKVMEIPRAQDSTQYHILRPFHWSTGQLYESGLEGPLSTLISAWKFYPSKIESEYLWLITLYHICIIT